MATAEKQAIEITVTPLDELVDQVYALMEKGEDRMKAIGKVVDSVDGYKLRKVWARHGYSILSSYESDIRRETGMGFPTERPETAPGKPKHTHTPGVPWFKNKETGESWDFMNKSIAIGCTGRSKYLRDLDGADIQVIVAFYKSSANTMALKAEQWAKIGRKLKAADRLGDNLSKLSDDDMEFIETEA